MKKYRKPTNAEKIEALKLARRVIDAHGGFVCLALDDISEASIAGRLTPACLALIEYIEAQLKGCYPKSKDIVKGRNLYAWLGKYRPDLPTDKAWMRLYRLQWIDWMIACLEGKEPAPPK